ncbi:hypothetical protein [Mesorhizobium sp. WSM1293]|uniref:hypothetical protein n=1 Tax=Mesorhizobium sp. WSM1293 TaxID=1040984 RepID=UPI00067F37A0|nr:hypothetical protein [Mesorhizobium sp. WSM1293]
MVMIDMPMATFSLFTLADCANAILLQQESVEVSERHTVFGFESFLAVCDSSPLTKPAPRFLAPAAVALLVGFWIGFSYALSRGRVFCIGACAARCTHPAGFETKFG